MKRFFQKWIAVFFCICLCLTGFPRQTSAATLAIRYNGTDYLYEDIQPIIKYNGETIALTDTPALIFDDVAMVPYYDVFVKNGPKVTKEGYSSATKQLVLSYNGTKIVLTVNSKTAYVNGVEKTLPVAPVSVTYKNSGVTRILVPSRAFCSIIGIDYSWNKSTRTVSMTSPTKVISGSTQTYYKGTSKAYQGKVVRVSFEGTTLNLTKTPAMTIQKHNMVPYYTALCKNGPKVKRSYQSKTKTLTLTYQSNSLTMTVGKKDATLNGQDVSLSVAPFMIQYEKKGSSYIMVPIKEVATYLGIHYSYDSSDRSITLVKGLSIKYDNKYYSYTGAQNSIYINGTKVSTAIPSINFSGIPYLPASAVCKSKYGLGVSYSYRSKKAVLDNGLHRVVLTMGSNIAKVDGEDQVMPGKARLIYLTSKGKNYVMVPAQFVCEALNLSYGYKGTTINMEPSEETGIDSSIPASTNTTYNYTMKAYATKQKNQNDNDGLYTSTTLSEYLKYINPEKDTTDQYQFLRLDTYRPISVSALSSLLATNGSGGVLVDQADAINNAAKRYQLDPVYFASQCIHETNWGKSTLSMGITSDVVAVPIYNSNGEVTGFSKKNGTYETKKLDKSYTAYNLFGIKAYDDDAQLCGFSYAYYNNWFTVEAAISGGAEYISKNYIHSSVNNQNTLYKMRFHPTDLNHQYATDPAYATKTAAYIKKYSSLYLSTATFQYEFPVFND